MTLARRAWLGPGFAETWSLALAASGPGDGAEVTQLEAW